MAATAMQDEVTADVNGFPDRCLDEDSDDVTTKSQVKKDKHLELQSMRNWYLLSTISAISTVGLVVAVTPVIRESISAFWPGANTDLALLVGLVGMVLILILHLTLQQLKVKDMRAEVRSMEDQAHATERKTASRMHALLNVTRMMGAVSDSRTLFQEISNTCLEIFDCQQASLMILNPATQLLEIKAASGHKDPKKILATQQPMGKGVAGHVAETMVPLILGGKEGEGSYRGFELKARQLTASMVAPIVARDELVGVINISSRRDGFSYSNEDLEALLVFAENVGACIRQAERSEWMRQTIERQQRQLHPGR